jgi:nucleoside-diphosphate-sugar epimerase
MRPSVLVTGAAGFLGANLALRLIDEGVATHLVIRPGSDPWRLKKIDRTELHETDLREGQAVERLVRKVRPQRIFHLAAHGAYSSQTDVHCMVDTNVTGTIHLLEACRRQGFRSFIVAGSSSEYGFQDHPPGEEEALNPNSAYAVTKAAATHYCRHMACRHSLPVFILRLYSIYGPWEEPTRLMPTLVLHAMEDKLPPLVHPDTARDFVFVDDAVEAFLQTARADRLTPGEIFNLGSGLQVTLQELVTLTRRWFSVKAEPRWKDMPNRSWDTCCWVSQSAKIRTTLGWEAKTNLRQGLQLLADWLASDSERKDFYWQRIRNQPSPSREVDRKSLFQGFSSRGC